MRILGVDPGCGGALVLLDTKLGAIFVHDMPTLTLKRGKGEKREVDGYLLGTLVNVMHDPPHVRIDAAYIEQVGGVTGQSASAAFNFGRACGAVEYTLKAHGIRVEMAVPQTWRRALKVNAGKDGSRAMAARLWPKTAQSFARKKDDGRAEAALIAEYGRRQMEGQNDDRISKRGAGTLRDVQKDGIRTDGRNESTTASNPGRNGIFG